MRTKRFETLAIISKTYNAVLNSNGDLQSILLQLVELFMKPPMIHSANDYNMELKILIKILNILT